MNRGRLVSQPQDMFKLLTGQLGYSKVDKRLSNNIQHAPKPETQTPRE